MKIDESKVLLFKYGFLIPEEDRFKHYMDVTFDRKLTENIHIYTRTYELVYKATGAVSYFQLKWKKTAAMSHDLLSFLCPDFVCVLSSAPAFF